MNYPTQNLKGHSAETYFPEGEVKRCPTCGRRGLVPCLVCDINSREKSDKPLTAKDDMEPTLDLQLTGEELERYNDVHRMRERFMPHSVGTQQELSLQRINPLPLVADHFDKISRSSEL